MKSAPDYKRGNETAARIILETPDVYGAGMVEWARRVRGEWQDDVVTFTETIRTDERFVVLTPQVPAKELHFHPDCFAMAWPKLGGDPQVEESVEKDSP